MAVESLRSPQARVSHSAPCRRFTASSQRERHDHRPDPVRAQFPALRRDTVFFDGPAGSQVPQSVIDAIGTYYVRHNANHGGAFATSRESDTVVDAARRACADLVGTADDGCIAFGANMTTLTFALARAIAARWQRGDEVIVTRLDHDANVSPWVRAADDRGATVRHVEIHAEDCTLDLDDYRRKLTSRTKLVAVGVRVPTPWGRATHSRR